MTPRWEDPPASAVQVAKNVPRVTWRMRFAGWLLVRLAVTLPNGAKVAPGGGRHVVCREPDGRSVVVVTEGETLDVYWSDKRRAIGTSMTGRTALRVALFIIWRYVILGTWCGLLLRAWRWAQRVVITGR